MEGLYVDKNNFKELNNSNPIGYSNNLNNSIVLLVHEKDKCLFFNISSSINVFNIYLIS